MRRSFVDTLREVRAGLAIEELDANLQQLVQSVQSTAKGGSLKLTVEIKPMRGSTEAVVVKASVSLKAPTFSDNGTVLFPTPEGNLTRTHHKQPDLPGITLATSKTQAADAA